SSPANKDLLFGAWLEFHGQAIALSDFQRDDLSFPRVRCPIPAIGRIGFCPIQQEITVPYQTCRRLWQRDRIIICLARPQIDRCTCQTTPSAKRAKIVLARSQVAKLKRSRLV